MALHFKGSGRKFNLKRDWKQLLTIAAIGLFITLWLGGIIAQFSPLAGLAGEAEPIRFNPISCIIANFTRGFYGTFCLILIYAALGIWLWMRKKDQERIDTENDERGFKLEGSGVYGTAALLKPEQARDFCEVEPLNRTTGLILGRFVTEENPNSKDQIVSIPPDGKRFKYDALGHIAVKTDPETGKRIPVRERLKTNGNRHMTVMGASGAGKSYSFARPAILQSILQGESIIITDPKGELYSDTSEFAKEHGYTVKILNLAYPPGSDSWDALAELKGAAQVGIEAQNICSIIIANTADPNGKSDEAYEKGELNLLTAIVLYVLTAPTYTGKKTLGAVYDIIAKVSEEDLFAMFEALPEKHVAQSAWGIYAKGSENWRGNIRSGLGVRLGVLQDEVIKEVTGVPDIDLTLPGKSKCAYYVIMSDMNSTFTFISSLFFTCLFNKLVEYSRRLPSQKLPVSVNVIMDEFIAIGKLPDFDKKLATVRSAGINICMIFQNLAQLQEAYPNGLWETLISNCYTLLCLACNDMTTAEYLSSRSGTATVALENLRVDRPVLGLGSVPSTVSHTYSVGQRPVLLPDEVISLAAENKVLVSLAGANLFVVDKFPYVEMVDPSTLRLVNMYEHSPAWATRNQYDPSARKPMPIDQPIADYESKRDKAKVGREEPSLDDDGLPADAQDMVEYHGDEDTQKNNGGAPHDIGSSHSDSVPQPDFGGEEKRSRKPKSSTHQKGTRIQEGSANVIDF